MATKTYSGSLGDLGRLVAALTANAAELPHLEGVRVRLEKMLAEAQEVLVKGPRSFNIADEERDVRDAENARTLRRLGHQERCEREQAEELGHVNTCHEQTV